VTTDHLYDLGGHVIAEINSSGAWDRGEVYAGGMHVATYDNGTTYFTHADWLGTERVRSTVAGGIYSTWTSYPFGEGSAAANPSPTHFTGKERDTESGLDYMEARYYGSSMGRFMSPDPILSSAHDDDPQTWNKYAYARNNPLRYSDPTGLDFSLGCSQNNGTTCQNGSTYYQDKNGNYQQTLIHSDAKGNLSDQSGNSYTANVSGSGVTFSGNGASNVAGTFVNGTAATTINGSGALSGFTFNFTYSDTKSGVNAGGTFSYNGTPDQTESALQKAGFTHYFGDNFDPFHLSTKDYRAADYRSAGAVGTGAGSGHFTVHEPWVLVDNQVFMFKPSSPTSGTLHLGESNPYTGGLVDHTKQVINNQLGTHF
jgi:RHS repeat-associated protein